MAQTIKQREPVREAFADRSSGNARGDYYFTKGHAINAYDAALNEHGYRFDYADTQDLYGDEGRRLVRIVRVATDEEVGQALLTWYRMPSGRYEFVGYIA